MGLRQFADKLSIPECRMPRIPLAFEDNISACRTRGSAVSASLIATASCIEPQTRQSSKKLTDQILETAFAGRFQGLQKLTDRHF
jgi:hypothetical protein